MKLIDERPRTLKVQIMSYLYAKECSWSYSSIQDLIQTFSEFSREAVVSALALLPVKKQADGSLRLIGGCN